MKTIYYAKVEQLQVPEEMTEEEIEELIKENVDGKEFLWSEENNLFEV